MVAVLIAENITDVSQWEVRPQNDLTLRKTTLTKLIHEAVLKLNIEPQVIRRQLEKAMKVKTTRRSQLETIKTDDEASLTKAQVKLANAFFTAILERPVDITNTVSEVSGGVFKQILTMPIQNV